MEKLIPLATKHSNPPLQDFSFINQSIEKKLTNGLLWSICSLALFVWGILLIRDNFRGGFYGWIILLLLLLMSVTFLAVLSFVKMYVMNTATHYYSIKVKFCKLSFYTKEEKVGKERKTIQQYRLFYNLLGQYQNLENEDKTTEELVVALKNRNISQKYEAIVLSEKGNELANFIDSIPYSKEVDFLMKCNIKSTLCIYFFEDGTRIALREESESLEKSTRLFPCI